MKTILALAIALFTFAAAPATTQACDYGTVSYCAPVVVCTKEICRHSVCHWATDYCGRRYSYEVTVVTYADYYSDGSCRRYTWSFRA